MAGVLGMADSGVVSMGIDICSKITELVNDYKTRDEQLGGVLRRTQRLKELLKLFDQAACAFASTQPEASHAVTTSVSACEAELRALRDVVFLLAPNTVPPADIREKMKETVKRLRFPFERSDIEKIEARLDRASTTLSRALDCLSLCSQSSINSGLVAMHSDVRDLISRFDELATMFKSRDDMVSQQAQNNALAMALMMKPSALRDMCDASSNMVPASEAGTSTQNPAIQKQSHRESPFSCRCRFRRRRHTRMTHLGLAFSFLEETIEERLHHPSCDKAPQSPSWKSSSSSLTYRGLAGYVSKAVSLGFAVSWGAGGTSIGPVLQCHGMVERKRAPAFVLLERMKHAVWTLNGHPQLMSRVVSQGLIALRRLYATGRALPTDVDQDGATMLTHMILMFRLRDTDWFRDKRVCAYRQVIETMLNLGIPTQGIGEHIFAKPAVYSLITKLVSSCGSHVGAEMKANGASEVLEQLSQMAKNSEGNLVPRPWSERGHWSFQAMELIARQVPEARDILAEVYGLEDALSMAVFYRNEDDLRAALDNGNSTPMEIETISRIAILWPRGLEMILSTPRTMSIINHPSDGLSLVSALVTSASTCTCAPISTRSDCICIKTLDVLLQQPTPIYLGCCIPWEALSLAAVQTLLAHIKYWRELLAELARAELPPDVQAELSLCDDSVLDLQASRICRHLENLGVFPNEIFGTSQKDSRLQWRLGGSIHHQLEHREHAQVAYDLGFKDVDCPDDRGVTPLAQSLAPDRLSTDFAEHVTWLLERGADLTNAAYPAFEFDHECQERRPISGLIPSHTIAHRLMIKMADCIDLPRYRSLADSLLHHNDSNHMSIGDECECHCVDTELGCSPMLVFLKRYISIDMQDSKTPLQLLQALRTVTETCGISDSDTPSRLIRLLAFEALGCAHTCCFSFDLRDSAAAYGEDFEEIRGQDAPHLARLEELVEELMVKFEQSCDSVFTFMETQGLQRIQEAIRESNKADLTTEEKAGMESLGVTFYGPKAWNTIGSIQNTGRRYSEEQTLSYAFWAEEFERIQHGDLSKPTIRRKKLLVKVRPPARSSRLISTT